MSALVADEVESEDGRRLGAIEELLIDVERGRITHAIVVVGGLFGFRRQRRAVPWSAFTPDGSNGALHLKAEALAQAPAVGESGMPLEPESSVGSSQ